MNSKSIVLSVVALFLISSAIAVISVQTEELDGAAGVTEIKNVDDLQRLSSGFYPLDGDYVQTCDIDFSSQPLSRSANNLKLSSSGEDKILVSVYWANLGQEPTSQPVNTGGTIVLNDEYIEVSPSEPLVGEFDYVGGEIDIMVRFGNSVLTYKSDSFEEDVIVERKTGGNFNPIGISPQDGTNLRLYGFSGTYDGNGYKIIGLNIMSSGYNDVYSGMFGYVTGGTIKNVDIVDLTITLASRSSNAEHQGMYAGGLVGMVKTGSKITISNCHVSGTINAITTSFANEAYLSSPYVGGLIGYASISPNLTTQSASLAISGCSSNVEIKHTFVLNNNSALQPNIGGIIGRISASSSLSPSTSSASITNCYNAGNITVNCNASSFARQSIYAGGITGYASVNTSGSITISKTYNEGNISLQNIASNSSPLSIAGGIVGYCGSSQKNGMTILNCYNIGDLYVRSETTRAYSSATSYSGGIVGDLQAYSIQSATSVSNTYNVGKIVSENNPSSYSNRASGGIVGKVTSSQKTYATLTNCYFDSNLSIKGTGNDLTIDGNERRTQAASGSCDSSAMKKRSCYYANSTYVNGTYVQGWNFNNVWMEGISPDDYPIITTNITINGATNGIITINGERTFDGTKRFMLGSDVKIEFEPESGYEIETLTVNNTADIQALESGSLETSKLTESKTLNFTFQKIIEEVETPESNNESPGELPIVGIAAVIISLTVVIGIIMLIRRN